MQILPTHTEWATQGQPQGIAPTIEGNRKGLPLHKEGNRKAHKEGNRKGLPLHKEGLALHKGLGGFGKSEMRTIRVNFCIILSLCLLVVYLYLLTVSWQGMAQVHTLMEAIAVFLAFFVSAMGFVRFYSKRQNIFLFIGAGFLGTGLLDLYHAFVTSSFYITRLTSVLPPLVLWSEMASRLFLPILFALSWWTWRRDVLRGQIGEATIYLLIASLALTSFLFFAFAPLPATTYFPNLAFIHQPQAFVPAFFYLCALIAYWRKGAWQENNFEYTFILSLIVAFMGEALFFSSSRQVFDVMFNVAHILKPLSYVFILAGLLISMFSIFRQAEASIEALSEAHQQLAIHSEELAQSNKDLETLLYVVSHDLKEPLRAIQSFSGIVRKRYASRLDSKGQDYLRRVIRGAERLRSLLDDILELSRAQRLEVPAQAIESEMIVRTVLDRLEATIKEKKASIRIIDKLPKLQVDETWATQAVYNLLSNALKYGITEDGTPDRRSPQIEIAPYDGPKGIGLVVKDRGPGVAPQHQERIFQLFQRAVGRKVEGTGAGLAIVRQVAERHGGQAWVQNRPGGGAAFFITFCRPP